MLKIETFLESDEYGIELFSKHADIEGLKLAAAEGTREDGITRKVGYLITITENIYE